MPFKYIDLKFHIRRGVVFLYMILILVVVTTVGVLQSRAFTAGKAWVDHTTNVIMSIQSVQITVLDAQTGTRGYVLTGDPSYLTPYRDAVKLLPRQLQGLRTLVADNPTQVARVDELQTTTSLLLDIYADVVEAREKRGEGEAVQIVLVRRSNDKMDRIRMVVLNMLNTERVLITRRLLHVDDSALVLSVSLAIIVIRDCFMLMMIVYSLKGAQDEKDKPARLPPL